MDILDYCREIASPFIILAEIELSLIMAIGAILKPSSAPAMSAENKLPESSNNYGVGET